MLQILRANDKVEAHLWDALIDSLPPNRRDIHFTSSYGRVQEVLGGESILAVMRRDDMFIAQPFIVRATPYDAQWSDLCSPYGYGGFVTNGEWVFDLAMEFRKAKISWCMDNNIVSEFCYIHPRVGGVAGADDVRLVKDIIFIDLSKFSEATVARRIRRGVIKARAMSGGMIQLQDQPVARERFASLYDTAMVFKHAAARWRFPRAYLDAHYDELNAKLFYVTNDEGGARILMVVGAYGTAYAHFLGSNGLSMQGGLDELLYCEAARWLREHDYEYFHLGGGLTDAPDDPLLFFKSGFSPTRHKVASYSRVYNDHAYQKLTGQKMAEEYSHNGRVSTSVFFPAYRREA